jgi:glycosyltransferase involved in cell wall biosynthesis
MRVAIATDIYLPQLSGIADSIETLATELARAGHDVRIYAPRVAGAVSGGNVRRLPAWSVPGSGGGLELVLPWGLLGDLRGFRPDVIHVHMFGAVGWAGVHAGRRLGVPVIGTDHTLPAEYLRYLHVPLKSLPMLVRRFAAAFYGRCRVVTAPSAAMLDELKGYGLKVPTVVISNPIRIDLFRPLERRDLVKRTLGIGPDAVLLFGRIAVEKNLDFAVDVFAAVAARRHAELVIVGDGPYRDSLQARLAALGLSARSRFLGELRGEALNQAINACDVYLITSRSETQSMTMLQASAAGLPVVAIRAGGLPEYVVDGQTGYLIDDSDRARFADRIVALLDDRGLARAIGAKGRELATKFAPAATAALFAAVYAQAAAGGAPGLPTAREGESAGKRPAPQATGQSSSG